MTRTELAGLIERARLSGANPDAHGANLVRADLSGMDLRGVDFTGADLRSANLSGCLGQGASFRRSLLGGADLSGSRWDGATFEEADMCGASFRNSVLHGANLHGRVDWVQVEGAYLLRAQRDSVICRYWRGYRGTEFRGGPADLPCPRPVRQPGFRRNRERVRCQLEMSFE